MSVSSFSPCQTSARGSTAAHSVGLLYSLLYIRSRILTRRRRERIPAVDQS
jgi:hypothetical protein